MRDNKQKHPKPDSQEPKIYSDARKYYGIHASRAIIVRRSESIEKIYLQKGEEEKLKYLITAIERKGLEFRWVGAIDLDRLTKSEHHQGVCVVAKERADVPFSALLSIKANSLCFLILDGIENPHNLGAILRSAAHYGVTAIIGDERLPKLSPAAVRTAEGAAEYIPLVRVGNLVEAIKALHDNDVQIIAADSGKDTKNVFTWKPQNKVGIVMGSEVRGLSRDIKSLIPARYSIPGTGWVESLNVNSAAAVFLTEWARANFFK